MKTPADVVEDSAVYLHIYFGGMVFNLVYNMGASHPACSRRLQKTTVCSDHYLCAEYYS